MMWLVATFSDDGLVIPSAIVGRPNYKAAWDEMESRYRQFQDKHPESCGTCGDYSAIITDVGGDFLARWQIIEVGQDTLSTEDLWIELGKRYELDSPVASAFCKSLPLVVLPEAACNALRVILAPILSNSKVYKKGVVLPEAFYNQLTPKMKDAMRDKDSAMRYNLGNSADLRLEVPGLSPVGNHPFLWELWTALGGSVTEYPFSSVTQSTSNP